MKILIIKLSSLGDVIHTLPVISAIKRFNPDAQITWLVNLAYVPLIRCVKGVDEVIPFDRETWRESWKNPKRLFLNFKNLASLIQQLRRNLFDLVLDLQCLFRSGFFSWTSASGQRWGLDNAREFSRLFYTRMIPVKKKHFHAVDQNMEMVKALFPGKSSYPVSFEWNFSDGIRQSVSRKLEKKGLQGDFCILAPEARWATKQWPYFLELAKLIVEKTRYGVVLIGSKHILIPSGQKKIVSLSGETSLCELAELISRSRFLVSNDSGPMHLAVAAAVPVIALMGPTRPDKTGPYRNAHVVQKKEMPCVPCLKRTCSFKKDPVPCLASITPEEVMKEISYLRVEDSM
ncbi:MAG: glycosyltransferase family 9 protein [Candidatus Aureabacteria bacterium]|nr:glycosyltransferase family 9 protein [Candidatus Auribacterota bacterium]